MQWPDRVVIGDAFGVVPHPVAVNDMAARGFGDADHPAVDVCGHAAEQLFGNSPILLGQFRRTRSWFAPMPPLATITAGARNSNSPTVFRDDATPRAAVVGSSTAPRTPPTAPFSAISSSTR